MRSRRDPAQKRRQISQAACELLPEVGASSLTHRLVASRAGVPLGSTTYYFSSLEDLVHETLEYAANETIKGLQGWSTILDASEDLPRTLASLVADYLDNRDNTLMLNQLYVAAGYRPELQSVARMWRDGLTSILAVHMSQRGAEVITTFIDGTLLRTLIQDDPIETETLTAVFRELTTIA